MSAAFAKSPRLESLLAGLLSYGTWLASVLTALGLVLALAQWRSGMPMITAGIAFFILLPVLRVILMLAVFVRERDYFFGAVAAIVLMVILAGVALGMHMASPIQP